MPGVLCSSGILNEHAGRVILCSSVHQALDGPASPLFSCQCWRVGGDRLGDGSTPMHDSAVLPCFHGCRTFLHRHFPPQSPPSPPLDPSLCSQQQPWPRDDSSIPKLQLPAAAPSKGCMAAARTVGFSCHLGLHRSAVPLSALNVSPLTQTTDLVWGLDPCFSSPTRRGQVQSE